MRGFSKVPTCYGLPKQISPGDGAFLWAGNLASGRFNQVGSSGLSRA